MRRHVGSTRSRALTAFTAMILIIGTGSYAGAQQPTPATKPQAQPKPQAKKPDTIQPLPSITLPVPEPQVRQFAFTPWTKVCGKDGPEGSNAKDVCGIETEARVETGRFAAAAALIELQDGSHQKLLRVTLPFGVRLPQGTRVSIDQGTPMQSNYIMCMAKGCMSDYEVSTELLAKLKSGKSLTIEGINPGGYPISLDVPLADFAKVYDGPATDQKVVLERQKKLQEELQRRADEARKKIEAQPPHAPSTTAPAAK